MATPSAEFHIIKERCFFCNQPEIIQFSEHYYFCPHCSAIYTFNLLLKSTCPHMKDDKNVPTVIRKPWFTAIRNEIYIDYSNHGQTCSKCGLECIADGW